MNVYLLVTLSKLEQYYTSWGNKVHIYSHRIL